MNKKVGVSSKAFVLLLAVVLTIGCVIGGSIAWLVSNPDPVTNTFTYGDINVTLTEPAGATNGNTFKILPGNDITKDPTVTVTANSEACWLFVKVDEANWPTFTEADDTTKKVAYQIAKGWTALTDETGVYYREVAAVTENTDFAVLKDNKVTVSPNLTKAEVNKVKADKPTLTFTAYAVQKDGVADAATAWRIAKPAPATPGTADEAGEAETN